MRTFLAVVSPAASTLSGEGWRQAGELGLVVLDPSRVAAQVVSGLASDVNAIDE